MKWIELKKKRLTVDKNFKKVFTACSVLRMRIILYCQIFFNHFENQIMLKKKLKWAIVPVVAAIAFVAFSSFTDESESAPKCKKVGESYDAIWTQKVNSDCT